MDAKFYQQVTTKLNEIQSQLSRIGWPELKNWLESFLALIFQSQKVLYPHHYLSLSKLFIISLSPGIPDQIHNITLKVFDNLLEYSPAKEINTLAFGIFPHAKSFTANNLDDFLGILAAFYARHRDCLSLILSIVSCILNGLNESGERSEKLIKFLEKVLKDYPRITEDLIWVYVIKSVNNHKPALKILKNIKSFNSNIALISRGFSIAASHEEQKIRLAAFDAVSEKYKIEKDEKNLHGFKVHMLVKAISLVQDQSIRMRIDRMMPNENNEYTYQIFVEAIQRVMMNEAYFSMVNFEHIYNTGRFGKEFLERVGVYVVEHISTNKALFTQDEEQLHIFNNLFSSDNYQIIWKSYQDNFYELLKKNPIRVLQSLCFSLEFFGKNPQFHKELSNQLLDFLPNLALSSLIFDSLYLLMKSSQYIPNNLHVLYEEVNNRDLMLYDKTVQFSFARYFYFISSESRAFRSQLKIDPMRYVEDLEMFLDCVELLVKFHIKISGSVLRHLWNNYYTKSRERINELLFESMYSEKSWMKIGRSMVSVEDDIKKLHRFLSTIPKNLPKCGFFSGLFGEVCDAIKTNENNVYLIDLCNLITQQGKYTFEGIFDYLLQDLNVIIKSNQMTKQVMKYFDCLYISINRSSISSFQKTIIQYDIADKLNKLKWTKLQCNVYFDIILAICFKYLSLNLNENCNNLCESACEVIHKICNHTHFALVQKIMNFLYETFEKTSSISTKHLLLRVLSYLNLPSKLKFFTREEVERCLKSTIISSLAKFVVNTGEISLISKLIQFYTTITPFYIDWKLENLIPSQTISMCFKVIVDQKALSLLKFVKDALCEVTFSHIKNNWLIENLIDKSPNLMEIIHASHKLFTEDQDTFTNIHDILNLLSQNHLHFLISSVIKLWIDVLNSECSAKDINIISNFLPFFQSRVDLIFSVICENLSKTKMFIFSGETDEQKAQRILNMLQFLYFYIELYENDIKITKDIEGYIGKILKEVNGLMFTELIIVLNNIFAFIIRRCANGNVAEKVKEMFREAYIEGVNNFLKAVLEPKRPLLNFKYKPIDCYRESHNCFHILARSLASKSYNLIVFFYPEQKKQHEIIASMLYKFIPKLRSNKHYAYEALSFFAEFIIQDIKIYPKLYDSLFSITNKSTLFEVFNHCPQACFAWLKVLNLCDSHTRLFEEFRKCYSPRNLNDPLELARQFYVTGMLIYSGKEDDYISPEVMSALKKEIIGLIDFDAVFPVSCLMLLILSYQWKMEHFTDFCSDIWGSLYCKFKEITEARNKDLNLYTSMLKLIDVLLALGFPYVYDLEYFTRPIDWKYDDIRKGGRRKSAILKDINPRMLSEIKEYESLLISQFQLYQHDQDGLDEKSIEESIEKEFERLKVFFS